jgi:site-specific DNA-methyltransferase (adenine-specific)
MTNNGITYLETADVPLTQLDRFPGNAKRGDIEAIRSSIRRHGQYRSLVVRATGDDRYTILAGNHTHDAIRAEGHPAARCEIIQCTDDEARRINLADNRLSELGSFDNDALTELLSYLDGDFEGTGYTQDDVDGLLGIEELPPALTDVDDVPDPPAEPLSKPGDIWHLGPHRVLCGDSTDVAAVETMLDGDRADCMWTDPPYGVDYVGKTKDSLTIQNDGAADLPELLAGAFATATAALKPGAPVYIAHPPGPLSLDFAHAFQNAGWLLRQTLIWVKDSMVLGRSDYHYRHEPIYYGFTDPEPGSGRLGRGGDRWHGDNSQTSILEVPKPPRNEDHPTMKPVELVTRCLTNSCPPGGIIYEPFGGSGTTLLAAHTTGRVARVVELDPRYVDVICRRFQEHTGTQPVLESTGEAHDFARPQGGDD